MTKTRGSSADLHLACAGPIGWEGPEYNENNVMARTGTAVHLWLRRMIDHGRVDVESDESFDIDHDIASIAYHTGVKIYDKLRPSLPSPLTEFNVEGRTTKGTVDVLSIECGSDDKRTVHAITILDWKLGMSDDEHRHQLAAYALAALDEFDTGTCSHVTVIEAWLMKGTYKVSQLSVEYLENFRRQLERQHSLAGRQFAAGDHCKYCPRRISCGVRDEYIRSSVNALMADEGLSLSPRELLSTLWDKSKIVERALAEYKKAVRTEVAVNGPIDLEDGRIIDLKEEERIVFHSPEKVIKAVGGIVGVDDIVKISKSSLEKAIKASAPKGRGAARVRAVMADLSEKDLLSTEIVLKLQATKKKGVKE